MLINQLQPFADILTHDKGLPIVSPSKSTVVPIVLPDVRHRDIMITHADGQVGRLVVIRASASGTFALKSTFTKLGIESKSGLDFRVIAFLVDLLTMPAEVCRVTYRPSLPRERLRPRGVRSCGD